MSDEANVSAAPSAAVIDTPATNTPELGSQVPDKPVEQQREEKASKSAAEAVKRAHEAVKAKEAEKAKAPEPKQEAKPAVKPVEPKAEAKQEPKAETRADRDRETNGQFKGSQPAGDRVQAEQGGDQTSEGRKPHHEPPARFNDAGKRDWANAPDSVREEVHRALKEMEDGHTKYKAEATRYSDFRDYDETAKKNGRDLKESIGKVVEFERMMSQNPIAAMEYVLREAGPRKQDGSPLTMTDIATHISGQQPDQRLAHANSRIQELEAENRSLKDEAKAPQLVQKFFEDYPEAQDYSDDIAFVLKNGNIPSGKLEDALEFVKRFKPQATSNVAAPSQPSTSAQSAQAHTPAPALNPAGQKSVSGSPGGISTAGQRPASKSNLEALKRAAARIG